MVFGTYLSVDCIADRKIFGIFPFSVAEFLLYVGILLLVGSLVRIIYRLIKKKADKKEGLRYLRRIGIIALILAALYMANCGINYHRNSFAESIGLKADAYTVDELKDVCMDLTERVNTYAGQVERDADGVMVLSGNEREEAVAAMERLGEKWTCWQVIIQSQSRLLFSVSVSAESDRDLFAVYGRGEL